MAVFNSKANGIWSSGGQTTWVETGIPGYGDNIYINVGHTITLTDNRIIGMSSGTGVDAITIAYRGKLVLDPGVTFTVRGDVTCSGSGQNPYNAIVMQSGSTWLWDGSLAAVPTGAQYVMKLGASAVYTYPEFVVSGASGSPCTMTSHTGGGNGRISNNGQLGGSIIANYFNYSRLGIGNTTLAAINLPTYQNVAKVILENVSGDNSYAIYNGAVGNVGSQIILRNVTTTNSLGTYAIQIGANTSSITTGTREIYNCSFDKTADISAPLFTITNNYFNSGWTLAAQNWTGFNSNFVYLNTTNTAAGLMSGNYFFMKSGANFTAVQTTSASCNIINNVIENATSGTANAFYYINSTSSPPTTHNFSGNISLPGPNGGVNNTFLSLYGNGTGIKVSGIVHNTYYASSLIGIELANNYSGYSGMLERFQSNLAWTNTPNDAILLEDAGTQDIVTGYITNCGYNGTYNKTSNRYVIPSYAITNNLTGFDVDGNPNFKDKTRNLKTWGLTRGADGTDSGAIELIKNNRLLIPELVNWVRSGFIVRNSAFNGTAHDGGVIGAMGYQQLPTVINPFTSVIIGIANDVIG